MDTKELSNMLFGGENLRVEFKEARRKMPSTLFETVSSFLNKDGGTILLGVDDHANITGIEPSAVDQMMKDIVSASNSTDVIDPPFTLSPQRIDFNGRSLLVLKIPASSQAHKHAGIIYDRENDSDLRITDHGRISEIYFRKRQTYTETQIFSAVRIEDFEESLFEKARALLRNRNRNHPWLEQDDFGLLRLAGFYRKDFHSGEEGFTLAAVLVFGKDDVIQSVLPAYKIDLLLRVHDTHRYDDRLTLRKNLIDSYDEIMTFVAKHLPDKFHLEGDQRIDLRTNIFREIAANIVVHREYTNALPTQFIIHADRVEATNPNKVHLRGPITLENYAPFPKNPTIAKFFVELGRVDELGSGLRNVNKFLPLYSGGAIPLFLEDDVFKTVIPLISYKLGQHLFSLLRYFNLEENHFPAHALNELRNIDIHSDLAVHVDDDRRFLFHCIKRYVTTALTFTELEILNNKELREFEKWNESEYEPTSIEPATNSGISPEDFGHRPTDLSLDNSIGFMNVPDKQGISPTASGHKLPGKRFAVIMKILFASVEEQSLESLMNFVRYSSQSQFKSRYIFRLIKTGLLRRTIPDKPTSPVQKYVLTEKGKLFLGAYEI